MRRLLVGIFCFASTLAHGQGDEVRSVHDSIAWEVSLPQMTVTSDLVAPFATGNIRTEIAMDPSANQLQELLQDLPSVYFKNYGNQQLSTISFRGTSASHTNVLWHGLSVNPAGLGQTDFSTWPVWLINDVTALPGSSGALYGSGAIGGSIHLDEIASKDTTKLAVILQQGSFGYQMGGLKANYRIGNIQLGTRIYGSQIDNDFEVTPTRLGRTIHQTNASVSSWGVKQSASFQYKSHAYTADLLYTINDREIQPTIVNLSDRNTLLTENLRIAANHQFVGEKYRTYTSVGYFMDETRYNISDITPASQWSLIHRSNWELTTKLLLQSGLSLSKASIESTNLANEAQQLSIEPFAHLAWYIKPNWEVTTSARYTMVDGQHSGVIPSVGTSYLIFKNAGSLNLKANWSGGYRYPTLNDRYWNPGGNPNLNAESSHQSELTLEYKRRLMRAQITAYQIKSTDWIIWSPESSGIWRPDNLRDVQNRGIEATVQSVNLLGKFKINTMMTSSYTLTSINKDLRDVYEGNQLPYTPNWLIHLNNKIQLAHFSVSIEQHFTSLRYTTVDNFDAYSLPAFYLLDSRIAYHYHFGTCHYQIAIEGKNLLNTYYELQQNLAMPGTNTQYSLQITF